MQPLLDLAWREIDAGLVGEGITIETFSGFAVRYASNHGLVFFTAS